MDRQKSLSLRIRENDEFSLLQEKALNNLVPAACNCPSKYLQSNDSPARIWILVIILIFSIFDIDFELL